MSRKGVTLADIQAAKQALHDLIEPSPLLRNTWLSEELGCEVHLKLECMQPIGSFKIRGATYKISRLSAAERKRGVIAASAGNHAQGVAWGAQRMGTQALIVMPKGASLVKVQNTRALGAEVELAGDTYDDAYEAALKIARKSGRVFVHAFDDDDVIAGQGTVGLEIVEQLPEVDYVLGSVGGGGLMAGTATAIKSLRPKTRVIGCQAVGADSMVRSFKKRRAVSLERVDTFADGIAVSQASECMRQLLEPVIDRMVEADDEAIASAVLTYIEKAKVVAEGAGALPLAVLETMRKETRGKNVVLIVSGGNIDVNLLSRIIDRGLIKAGRRVRLNVVLHDRPGELARLTQLLASEGANIIQAIHDRSEPSTLIDQTEVALTLETRGKAHSQELISALKSHVMRLELAQ